MKIAIVGRTGTGKTELANRLRERGLAVMTSTTTRPPRSTTYYARTSSGDIVRAVPDGNGDFTFPEAKPGETCVLRPDLTVLEDGNHYFITPEEAAAIPDTEKLLYTTDTGYEYFVTPDEIERADVCVVDPRGLESLCRLLPETSIQLVHAVSVDDAALTRLAVARADDPDVEAVLLTARQRKEDPVFRDFEDKIRRIDPDTRVQRKDPIQPNCVTTHPFENDFSEATVDAMADYLTGYYHMFKNLKTIVGHAIDLGIVVSEKPGHVDTTYRAEEDDPARNIKAGDTYVRQLPVELYVDVLTSAPDMLFTLLKYWLNHEQDLGQPKSLSQEDADETDPDEDAQMSLFDEVVPTPEDAGNDGETADAGSKDQVSSTTE